MNLESLRHGSIALIKFGSGYRRVRITRVDNNREEFEGHFINADNNSSGVVVTGPLMRIVEIIEP